MTGTLTHSQAHDIAGPSLPQISLERTGNDNLNQAVMLKTRYLLMRAPTHTYNAQTHMHKHRRVDSIFPTDSMELGF